MRQLQRLDAGTKRLLEFIDAFNEPRNIFVPFAAVIDVSCAIHRDDLVLLIREGVSFQRLPDFSLNFFLLPFKLWQR